MFQTSLEQVFHWLSTPQRPGACGVPLYFVRVDQAGNVTKHHIAPGCGWRNLAGPVRS